MLRKLGRPGQALVSNENHSRRASRAFSASTPCIKGIGLAITVYHINAVDEVTQFQVVCTVEKISEAYLIPALEQLLATFPFPILGFHSGNGSEYINGRVATLLAKLLIESTKLWARQTNDNILAESKNGHVVRKLFGHAHIPPRWSSFINALIRSTSTFISTFIGPVFFQKFGLRPMANLARSTAMKR